MLLDMLPSGLSRELAPALGVLEISLVPAVGAIPMIRLNVGQGFVQERTFFRRGGRLHIRPPVALCRLARWLKTSAFQRALQGTVLPGRQAALTDCPPDTG